MPSCRASAPNTLGRGHSLGAVKDLHAQAHLSHAAVSQVIAVSPPRLMNVSCQVRWLFGDFLSSINEAKRPAARGYPEMLFRATFPFPLILSAAVHAGSPCRQSVPRIRSERLRCARPRYSSFPKSYIPCDAGIGKNRDNDRQRAPVDWRQTTAVESETKLHYALYWLASREVDE